MTVLELIDRNFKAILIFVGLLCITGGFGAISNAYVESAEFYGWVRAIIAKMTIKLDF